MTTEETKKMVGSEGLNATWRNTCPVCNKTFIPGTEEVIERTDGRGRNVIAPCGHWVNVLWNDDAV